MIKFKPLNWKRIDNNLQAVGINQEYVIRPTESNDFTVTYYNVVTKRSNTKFALKSEDAAIWWVENIHHPSQVLRYIDEYSTTQNIYDWFKDAKPEPKPKDISTQIGAHVEEFVELLEALKLPDEYSYTILALKTLRDEFYEGSVAKNLYSYTNSERVEILDALCDQIVTSIGIGYMFKFKMEKALKEVAASNNSKKDDSGKFIYNKAGKIMKSDKYFPPSLSHYT